MLTRTALFAVVVTAPLTRMTAQLPASRPSPYTVEIDSRTRWMNARQTPILTPHSRTTTWIGVDSVVTDSAAGARLLWGKVGNTLAVGEQMKVLVARDGHLRDVTVQRRALPTLSMIARTARDSARFLRNGLLDLRANYMTLPGSRAWDLVPVFRPPRLAAGAQWVDTINNATTVLDLTHTMRGVRTYTIQRDTSIDGKRYWIVRDSATVTMNEQFPVDERRLDNPATMERQVAGRIIGRTIVDAATGLLYARTDTTDLRGNARLQYPDGRVFTTPTRFDRAQRWSAYDSASLARRQAQIAAEREANSFSIVRVARNPLEERLGRGDKPTLDSLYRTWQASRDPDQREAIKDLLRMWQRDSSSRARLQAALAAEGDTVYLIESAGISQRFTTDWARLALRLMRDPGLALAYGASRDIPYERPVEVLAFDPPAIEPDSSKWKCEPAACRLIAAEWRTATEPRLRSVALAVLTLMNPRQWRDTFLVLAHAGDNVLQLALPIVEGSTVAGIQRTRGAPIPDAGADWTAWREWVRGPAMPTPVVSGRGSAPPPPPRWLTTGGNVKHIQFAEAAGQRDITAELRRLYQTAPNDTAVVVLANILAGLKALPFGDDSIVAFAIHPNPLFRSLGSRLISGSPSMPGSGLAFAKADSATGAAIHTQLISSLINKREPWPTLQERQTGGGGAGPFREPPTDNTGAQLPIYYDLDSVTVAVRDSFAGRMQTMPSAEWRSRPSREGGELWSISRVDRSGRFARVSVSVAGRIQRAPNQGPQAWYSSTTYFLVEVGGEWLLVNKLSAVT